MSSSPPTTLGKYQIIREIARSNDIVYEAYDPLMNRRVAVKELAMPSGANDAQRDDRLKRFLREARAAGSLQHPNIMTVFEVGEDSGRHYIAMEYLDGHTLRNEIDTKGFIPVEDAIQLSKDVLSGLDYAHSKGVIHRDIKPDNIQILSDGSVKITDFGIARLTFEPNLTMDGQVFGTPSYMSPEQVVGREIDARSDLFSVGVMLYEMVSGKKPFAGDSVVSITYAIMNKDPDRPQQANFALWQAIEKSLDKSPQLRYASAKAMIEGLDGALRASSAGPVIDPGAPQIGGSVYPPAAQGQLGYGQPGYAQSHGVYGQFNQAHPAPGANPYAGTYGQPQPAAPPVVYPYNPYQAPGAGHSAPHTPNYVNPIPPGINQTQYSQAPIYYPPPPRTPLLRPETKYLLGRVLLVFLVLGLIIAAIYAILNSVNKVGSNGAQAAQVTPQAGPPPPKMADQATPDASGGVDDELLASQEERDGNAALAAGDLEKGLNLLKSSYDRDPQHHATAAASFAAGCDDAARRFPKDARAWLEDAGEYWDRASQAILDPERAHQYGLNATSDFIALANLVSSDHASARQYLARAKKTLPSGESEKSAEIDALYDKLRG